MRESKHSVSALVVAAVASLVVTAATSIVAAIAAILPCSVPTALCTVSTGLRSIPTTSVPSVPTTSIVLVLITAAAAAATTATASSVGEIDFDPSPIKVCVIEPSDGTVRAVGVAERDETEPTRATGLAVAHYNGINNLAVGVKRLT